MNALSGWSDLFCTYKVIFSIPWPKYIDYLRQVFPQFSDSKLKEDIFNLVTNYKIARRYPFYRKAPRKTSGAWNSFVLFKLQTS